MCISFGTTLCRTSLSLRRSVFVDSRGLSMAWSRKAAHFRFGRLLLQGWNQSDGSGFHSYYLHRLLHAPGTPRLGRGLRISWRNERRHPWDSLPIVPVLLVGGHPVSMPLPPPSCWPMVWRQRSSPTTMRGNPRYPQHSLQPKVSLLPCGLSCSQRTSLGKAIFQPAPCP